MEKDLLPQKLTIIIKPSNNTMAKYLQIIGKVLAVDKEIDPDNLTKNITINQNNNIIVKFESKQLKLLRSCVTGFLRHMRLTVQTIKQFEPNTI